MNKKRHYRLGLAVLSFLILLVFPISVAPAAAYHTGSGHTDEPHDWIMDQAIEVLRGDGYTTIANEMGNNANHMKDGSYDADHGGGYQTIPIINKKVCISASEHFYDPYSGLGFMGLFKSAATYAQDHFKKAIEHYKKGQRNEAYFQLGYAVHVLQDLTVPQHTRVAFWEMEAGHEAYEAFINGNKSYIQSFTRLGYYDKASSAYDWVKFNAKKSYGYYGYVNGKDGSGNNDYNYAANVLLPWAVKSCAGFLRFFYEEANRGRQESYGSGTLWSRGDTYTKYVDVPWGRHTVVLAGNEPGADFDLYVKWGAPPTTTSWDARGYSSDSLEHVTVKGNGRLYYMVRAFSGSGRWKANVVYGSPRNDAVIIPGRLSWYSGLETGGLLSGKDDAEWSASFGDSRNGMMHAWVYLAGPDSADFDLYIRWRNFATKSTYDDIGYSWRSQEICDAYRMGSDAYLFVTSHSYRGSGNYRLLILIF